MVVQRCAKPPGVKAPLCVRVAPPPLCVDEDDAVFISASSFSFEPVAQKD